MGKRGVGRGQQATAASGLTANPSLPQTLHRSPPHTCTPVPSPPQKNAQATGSEQRGIVAWFTDPPAAARLLVGARVVGAWVVGGAGGGPSLHFFSINNECNPTLCLVTTPLLLLQSITCATPPLPTTRSPPAAPGGGACRTGRYRRGCSTP